MRTLVSILAGSLLLACSTPTPITTWPYSAWGAKTGAGSMGGFEQAQQGCLEQLGITDPGAVARDSSTERGYLACMNEAGWCTELYGCDAPGA